MEQNDYYIIEKAIQYLEKNFKNQPTLEEIAKEVHLSPFHFQKLFKKWAGISPKKFVQFLTIEYIKSKLVNSESVLESTYDAGLSSTSRVHELFVNVHAMSPKEFKELGKNLKINYAFFDTQFGRCLIASTEKGLCSLSFSNNHSDQDLLNELKNDWKNAEFILSRSENQKYFDKIFKNKGESINVLLKGTDFQIQVWKALLKIPAGSLTTYDAIAKNINHPKATRAVGTAIGRNNIAYLIPCHRVINKIGVIGNYRWGSNRKKTIIGLELAGIN